MWVYLDDEDSWVNVPGMLTAAERAAVELTGAQLIVPVLVRGELAGCFLLGARRSGEPYSGDEIRLLESVAAQAALALENGRLTRAVAEEAAQKERVHRELEIAREVQGRLFPRAAPRLPGIAVAGFCRPAQAVGGDYYDYFELPGGRLGFAVADVSGKGVAAAITMATVQASLRTLTIDSSTDLAGMVGRLNRVVFEASASNRFATLFYAQFDPKTGLLRYVNCGHNAPLVLRRGELLRPGRTGIALGLRRVFAFGEGEMTLQPGDTLVAFSDGISEAMNDAREEWGEDRLAATVREVAGEPPEEIARAILAAADEFAAGAPQHDDMTLVVLRVDPNAE
ncbi:MAG: PP2C family protein-serine/threonine phosphatase [Acidobacteria bacterium]|nr:PP2C family protein-serine/threonine phosphatase [Acidobacteriota bacterium]